VNARPIIGHDNRIAWVGRIVFHAGGLSGGKQVQPNALFEASHVLRGFIGHAGDGIAVADELAAAVREHSACLRPGAKQSARFRWRRRHFHKLGHLAFNDAAYLVNAQPATPFQLFRCGSVMESPVQSESGRQGYSGPGACKNTPIRSEVPQLSRLILVLLQRRRACGLTFVSRSLPPQGYEAYPLHPLPLPPHHRARAAQFPKACPWQSRRPEQASSRVKSTRL
jgi:hypothetical protein